MKQTLALLAAFVLFFLLPAMGAENNRLELLLAQGRFKDLKVETARILNTSGAMDEDRRLLVMKYWIDGLMGTGQQKECLKACNEIIELPKADSLRYYDVNAYIAMNDIFCQLNYVEPARLALDKADETLTVFRGWIDNNRWNQLNESLHMSRSIQAQAEGDLNGALREWQKVPCYDDKRMSHVVAWHGLGGTIYHDMGEIDKAEELFRNALETEGFSPNKLPVLLRYMAIKIEDGDFNGAITLYNKYKSEIEAHQSPRLRGMLLNAMADALRGLGKYSEASELYSQSIDCLDSVVAESSQVVNQILLEHVNPSDYTALQRRVETAQTQKHRVTIVAFAVVLVLLSAVCLILLLKVRQSRRLRRTEDKLARLDSERREERAELAEEISARNAEICRLSMAASQSESTIVTIRTELHRKSATIEERLHLVESALRDSAVDACLRETFRERFDSSNQQLYSCLTQHHPNLTKAEMNMAAYVLLNMTSKEIAQISNRSIRTVDNIKYSLRKKLAISEPVHVYLRRLLSESE